MQLPCIFAHLRILLRTYARRAVNKFVWAGIDVTYAGDSTELFVCNTQSTGFKWERASLSNGVPILVTALLR